MKPHITTDFLRGVLFTYSGYNLYVFIAALLLGINPFQPFQFFVSALFIVLYGFITIALLFYPNKSSMAVFLCLVALALAPIFGHLYYSRQAVGGSLSPLTSRFFLSVALGIAAAVIAYFHHKNSETKKA